MEAKLEYITAGFPSPANDYLEDSIDLNKILIRHKESTFFARIVGDSMKDAGILDGDIAVIDKSLEAHDGSLIAAFIDGEFTLKRYHVEASCAWLLPANQAYKPIQITAENEFCVWGVVTAVVHQFR